MKLVGVNERGLRVGQDHQRAKLLDADIASMFALRAEGLIYQQLAVIFECSKTTAWHIINGRQRSQRAVAWRRIESNGKAEKAAA